MSNLHDDPEWRGIIIRTRWRFGLLITDLVAFLGVTILLLKVQKQYHIDLFIYVILMVLGFAAIALASITASDRIDKIQPRKYTSIHEKRATIRMRVLGFTYPLMFVPVVMAIRDDYLEVFEIGCLFSFSLTLFFFNLWVHKIIDGITKL